MQNDHKYQKLIRYLARPKEDQKYASLTDMMNQNQITPAELSEFKHRETFEQDVYRETMHWARMQTPQMLHGMYETIKSRKSMADMERWMKIVMDDGKESNPTGNTYNFNVKLSPKQRETLASRLSILDVNPENAE